MSNTLDKIGELLNGQEQRDAIHVAVAPVMASNTLNRGDYVALNEAGQAVRVDRERAIGIVDPFLTWQAHEGYWFYLFLFPNTIVSLRHEWTHPAFAKRDESLTWLTQFAAIHHAESLHEMLAECVSGGSPYFGTTSGPEEAQTNEFWFHIEMVTGKKFDQEHRRNTSFRCAC